MTNLRRASIVSAAVVLLVAMGAGCTPAQFQAWWVQHGNEPLAEPELSQRAAAATAYWAEIARRDRFTSQVSPITPAIATRITPTSWRPGCPVSLGDLRYVRMSHMDFGGRERTGEMILHADTAGWVIMAFKYMWDRSFPIHRMQLVDDFGGNDDASMAANNTSGFNCRRIAGATSWSQHAYGRAIDINPVQNPYVAGSTVAPPAGTAYLNRAAVRPGMIVPGSPPLEAFGALRWGWGGNWAGSKDYQHLSVNGR